jgi:hypothetical protein
MTTPEGTPPAGEGTPPAGDVNYYDGYDDATKGWLNNRGMDKLAPDAALASAIKGHMSAEQSLGVPQDRRIDLPVDQAAPGAMDGVYNRLGRPEAADGYVFSSSEADGSDKAFDTWAKEKFHAAGLTADNANALYTDFKTFIGETVTRSAADAEVTAAAATADLQREWGTTYERNKNIAEAAAAKFGLAPAAFDAIKASMEPNEAMKLFQKIGASIGEDPFVNPALTPENNNTTPEGAKSEINALKKDQEWVKKYIAGDLTARNQMDRLQKIAAA